MITSEFLNQACYYTSERAVKHFFVCHKTGDITEVFNVLQMKIYRSNWYIQMLMGCGNGGLLPTLSIDEYKGPQTDMSKKQITDLFHDHLCTKASTEYNDELMTDNKTY